MYRLHQQAQNIYFTYTLFDLLDLSLKFLQRTWTKVTKKGQAFNKKGKSNGTLTRCGRAPFLEGAFLRFGRDLLFSALFMV